MKRLILIFELQLVFTVSASSQIEGDIVDSITDKGITNARIIATNISTKATDTVITDYRGFYIFKTLKKGNYKIEVKAAGFLTALLENVKVIKDISEPSDEEKDVTNATRLDISLKPEKVPK
jgi:hypothetical protein